MYRKRVSSGLDYWKRERGGEKEDLEPSSERCIRIRLIDTNSRWGKTKWMHTTKCGWGKDHKSTHISPSNKKKSDSGICMVNYYV